MDLTIEQLGDFIKDSLKSTLISATQQDREQYLAWATEMTPLITQYAARYATGDALAGELLEHLKAQAEAKLWVLADAEAIAAEIAISDLAMTVAVTAGKILQGFVAKYGVVLLGLA